MKILAVDDEKLMLDFLYACLSEARYTDFTSVSDPELAMRTIVRERPEFDCILLDINMPGKSGLDMCREIRAIERYRHVPIIMITSKSDRASVSSAFAKGATDYLTKPFDAFEVVHRIRLAGAMVAERKAARDSYLALERYRNSDTPVATRASSNSTNAWIEGRNLVGQQELRNYLSQVTKGSDLYADIFGIRLMKADAIFEACKPTDFIDIMDEVGGSVLASLDDDNSLVSLLGNGTFVCATGSPIEEDLDSLEDRIQAECNARLSRRFPEITFDLIATEPFRFSMLSRSQPNLDRIRKVIFNRADARIEARHRGETRTAARA